MILSTYLSISFWWWNMIVFFPGLYLVRQFGNTGFRNIQISSFCGNPFRHFWMWCPIRITRKALCENPKEVKLLDSFSDSDASRSHNSFCMDPKRLGGIWYLDRSVGCNGAYHYICTRSSVSLHDHGSYQKIQIVQ